MFAALGRLTVRYRWPIIAGWIVATVLLMMCLPTLSSVEKSSNSQFLPSTAASVRADRLASPFNPRTTSTVTFVASTAAGTGRVTGPSPRPTTRPSTAWSSSCAPSRG